MPLIDPSIYRAALLNAIAAGETEGSRRRGYGYNVLYGGGHFVGYTQFPTWAGERVAGAMTHAAGRYQFQPGTWSEVAVRYRLPDFSPASQDEGAYQLAKQRYRRVLKRDLETDLSTLTLAFMVEGLKPTWQSIGLAFQRRLLAFCYEQV